jgi:hypothetical protein
LINQLSADRAGPGHWNDPDMLQVGNELLTLAEEKSHFALWAFAKAPLIIGCDLNTISAESLAILSNKNLIAINQDSKGVQAKCVYGCAEKLPYHVYQTQIYEVGKGAFNAFLAINWDDENEQTVSYDPVALGSAVSKSDNCKYIDLYDDTTPITQKASVFNLPNPVAPHEHAAYKVQCLPW